MLYYIIIYYVILYYIMLYYIILCRDTTFLQQIVNHQKIKAHFDHSG